MVAKNTSKKSWCLLNVPPLPEGPVEGGNSPLPHLPPIKSWLHLLSPGGQSICIA